MYAIIQVRDLHKTYRMGEIDVHALRGVSFAIQRGEFVAIMGPSGSGKSTLMNLLGCLDTPSEGEYILDGVPVGEMDKDLLAAARNRKIGFVFQQFNLLPRQSALENVALPLVYSGGVSAQERTERAQEVLELVGLGERMGHRPKELSGGQQQRVAIARALITRPALLLADEPTGNLDSHATNEILRLFEDLNRQGITIVLVTHEPDVAEHAGRVLTVRSGASNSGGVGGQVGTSQTLTTADATALADSQNVPDASAVSPEYSGNGQLVAGSANTNARITGAVPVYATAHNLTLASGEFISDDQERSNASVAVLGANVATTLFPNGDAVGNTLRINGVRFTVAGVLAATGGTGFGSQDDGIIVPLSTAQHTLFGGRAISGGDTLVSTIVVQAKDAGSVTAALGEITQTLRERHNLPDTGTADDFGVINQQDQLASVAATTQTLTLFLGAIAAISLLVGGIGIMNIMLVSVRERTREIGLRKAIGAREGNILTQFMLEALIISTLGGLIGLALGVLIALGVNVSGLMKAQPSLDAAALAVGFAMAVGLFFGIAPARSAARLDPIDALRYE